MSSGDLTTQSLTAASGEYQPGFFARAINAVVGKIFYSAITNRKPASMSAVRRSAVASADTSTLNTFSGSAIDCGQSQFADLSVRFSAASQSCAIFLVLMDASGAVMNHTADYTFQGEATITDGTLYPSPGQLIDLKGASSYYPYLRVAPSSGTVSIYSENL